MPRRGPEAGSTHKITGFYDFHGSGVNSLSCMFLQNRNNLSLKNPLSFAWRVRRCFNSPSSLIHVGDDLFLINVPEKFNREMWFNEKDLRSGIDTRPKVLFHTTETGCAFLSETRPAIVRTVFGTCPDMDDFPVFGTDI